MRIIWIDRPDQLEPDWIQAWRKLAEEQGKPYCLPEWMLGWWEQASPEAAELRIAVALDDDRVRGIGPFFVDRHSGVRRLRLLGVGTSSAPSMLVDTETEGPLAEAVRDRLLLTRDAHLIVLEGVSERDRWTELLLRPHQASGARLRPVSGWEQPAPYLDMSGGGYEEWFAAQSSSFRAKMRRGARQLQQLGGSHRLEVDPSRLSGAIRDFAKLHRSRWEARGGSGVLTDGVERLLLAIAADHPDAMQVWMVDLDGRPISAQVFITAGRTISHWQGGVDDSVTSIRPAAGILSLHEAIKHAWESGFQMFDFGAGGQEHKYRFASGDLPLSFTCMGRNRPLAYVARLRLTPEWARASMLQRLPPGLKRRLRNARRRYSKQRR
jgi:CelD/BcsL family acetyltransferase involved in cellulose biosynthesis